VDLDVKREEKLIQEKKAEGESKEEEEYGSY
jgi:hypothetical protein